MSEHPGFTYNRRHDLTRAWIKLHAFEQSAHPDDRRIAELVKSLDVESDDFILLVAALREPGSAKAPNRPKGTDALRKRRIEFLARQQRLAGRSLTHADITRLAPLSPGRAGDKSKERELEKALKFVPPFEEPAKAHPGGNN